MKRIVHTRSIVSPLLILVLFAALFTTTACAPPETTEDDAWITKWGKLPKSWATGKSGGP